MSHFDDGLESRSLGVIFLTYVSGQASSSGRTDDELLVLNPKSCFISRFSAALQTVLLFLLFLSSFRESCSRASPCTVSLFYVKVTTVPKTGFAAE